MKLEKILICEKFSTFVLVAWLKDGQCRVAGFVVRASQVVGFVAAFRQGRGRVKGEGFL